MTAIPVRPSAARTFVVCNDRCPVCGRPVPVFHNRARVTVQVDLGGGGTFTSFRVHPGCQDFEESAAEADVHRFASAAARALASGRPLEPDQRDDALEPPL